MSATLLDVTAPLPITGARPGSAVVILQCIAFGATGYASGSLVGWLIRAPLKESDYAEVGLLGVAAGAVLCMIAAVYGIRAASFTEQTRGFVSSVSSSSAGRDDDGEQLYRVQVDVSYEVAGESYTIIWSDSSGSRSAGHAWRKKGDSVMVSYNPFVHSEAVVGRPARSARIFGAAGFVFMAIAGFVLT